MTVAADYQPVLWLDTETYFIDPLAVAFRHSNIPFEHFGYPDEAHGALLSKRYTVIITEVVFESEYRGCPISCNEHEKRGIYLIENAIRTPKSPNIQTPIIVISKSHQPELDDELKKYEPISIYRKQTDIFGDGQKRLLQEIKSHLNLYPDGLTAL